MTKYFSRDNTFGLGIASFVALGLFGAFILAISVIPFGTKSYHAELTHTAGLRAKEGVSVAGVEVGEVTKVRLDGRRVIVDFTLDKDIGLGGGTTADVRVGTLLGTHYLAVVPKGSGSLANDTIPLARTSVPFNLQDVIDEGTGAVEQIDGAKVAESLSIVADTLKAAGPELVPAFKGVTRISEVINQREGQFAELLQASTSISNQLADSTDDLTRLMEQSNLVIDELVRRREAIHDLLDDIVSITSTINKIMDDNVAELRPMLDNLNEVVGVLNDRDEDLKSAIHKLAVTSRYFANATGDGPFINLYMPENVPDKLRCGVEGAC